MIELREFTTDNLNNPTTNVITPSDNILLTAPEVRLVVETAVSSVITRLLPQGSARNVQASKDSPCDFFTVGSVATTTAVPAMRIAGSATGLQRRKLSVSSSTFFHVGPDSSVSPVYGYRVATELDITTNGDVWVYGADGQVITWKLELDQVSA